MGHCNTLPCTTLLATALETQEFERCKSESLQALHNELRLTVVDLMLRTITGTDVKEHDVWVLTPCALDIYSTFGIKTVHSIEAARAPAL